MAKTARKPKAKEPSPSPGKAPSSALQAAFDAYQLGDVVAARRLTERVLAAPTPQDEASAQRLATPLFGDGKPGEKRQVSAAEVATDLRKRLETPPKLYLFALMAALIMAGLITLAIVRT